MWWRGDLYLVILCPGSSIIITLFLRLLQIPIPQFSAKLEPTNPCTERCPELTKSSVEKKSQRIDLVDQKESFVQTVNAKKLNCPYSGDVA